MQDREDVQVLPEVASDESDDDEVPMLLNVDEGSPLGDEPAELAVDNSKQTTNEAVGVPAAAATVDSSSTVPLPPCPVTILSGFLGAGKTTLIQYILQSPDHGKRIAVIENEFGGGDEGLSVENIIARDGANQKSLSDLIELPNGCICCTVKDSLVETLENLLTKRNDLDYILIEASGMANPGPIASLFWLDDELESRLRLDGVVTIVDALNLETQLKQTEEAAQQIAYADRILLNKVDLIDHNTDTVLQHIRSIHPTAPVRTTTYSKVPDLEWILDANCFDVDRAKEVDMVLSRVAGTDHKCSDASCQMCVNFTVVPADILESTAGVDSSMASKGDVNKHIHTSAVGTTAFVLQGSVELARMNSWLASILWPNQDEKNSVLKARLEQEYTDTNHQSSQMTNEMEIFRVKGILSVQHQDVEAEDEEFVDENGIDVRRYIVQAVNDLWEIHPASEDLRWDRSTISDTIPSERSCKVVIIGKKLNEAVLKEGFESCLVSA